MSASPSPSIICPGSKSVGYSLICSSFGIVQRSLDRAPGLFHRKDFLGEGFEPRITA